MIPLLCPTRLRLALRGEADQHARVDDRHRKHELVCSSRGRAQPPHPQGETREYEEARLRVGDVEATWASRGATSAPAPPAGPSAEMIMIMSLEARHGRPLTTCSSGIPGPGLVSPRRAADAWRSRREEPLEAATMTERPPLAYQPYASKRHSQQSFSSFTAPSSPPTWVPANGIGGSGASTPAAVSGPSGGSRPGPFIRPGHSRPGSGFDFDRSPAVTNGRPGPSSAASPAGASPPRVSHLGHGALMHTPPRHSPLAPPGAAPASSAFAHAPPIPSSSSRPQLATVSPPGRGSGLPSRHPSESSAFSLAPQSGPSSGTASPNRPSTPAVIAAIKQGGQAPYRPGFQAKGVYRDITENYTAARRGRGEARRLDEGRLQKRLDKLVELHFPHPAAAGGVRTGAGASQPPSRRPRASLSSFSSLTSLSSLAAPSPANPSVSFLSRLASTSNSSAIRDTEQAIVRWQDDASAKRCAVCGAPFSVRTRKHHCRLCGRVVCFLPPNFNPSGPHGPSHDAIGPLRRERCSTFVTYEWDHPESPEKTTGELVELDDDEMGLAPAISPSLASAAPSATAAQPPAAALPKRPGVRVCRECLSIVLRRQAMTRPAATPTYMRLHEVLTKLESEVERLLEEFGESVVEMQCALVISRSRHAAVAESMILLFSRNADGVPSNAALSTRKRLLSTLASYDSTARRISDLPLAPGNLRGGAQDRLQCAIGLRAAIFLQERMAMVRGLGGFELEKLGQPPDPTNKTRGKHQRGQRSLASTTTLAELRAGGPDSPSSGSPHRASTPAETSDTPGDVEDRAARLAVLLEQETLVAGYLEEAQARRQLEDAGSLQASLADL